MLFDYPHPLTAHLHQYVNTGPKDSGDPGIFIFTWNIFSKIMFFGHGTWKTAQLRYGWKYLFYISLFNVLVVLDINNLFSCPYFPVNITPGYFETGVFTLLYSIYKLLEIFLK